MPRPFLFLLCLLTATAQAATVTISCGAVGKELQLCREGAAAWARASGNRVEVVSTPHSSNDRLALYQQILAAHSPDIDVFQIDVIWPGILQQHLLDLHPFLSKQQVGQHFDSVIANNTVDGRLVALPWFMDAGLLYYRKDLLEKYHRPVPKTWAELTETAALIQHNERRTGNRRLWGFVWQGRAYEGLTCDALEWIYSHGGGTIVNQQGEVTFANPRAAEAIEQAAGWVRTITPEGVLNYDEEQSRGVFQSGNAVFMRNWPYAWPLLNGSKSPVRDRVGIAPLPHGPHGPSAATLGGWALAVSRYSDVQQAAVDLVRYLTSAREQKRRALAGGYNPTRPALYKDPELLRQRPILARLSPILTHAVARPAAVTGARYNIVSSAFWNAVHATLAGQGGAMANLQQAKRRLQRRLRR